MHCNLRPPDVASVVLGCFGPFHTAHVHNSYFAVYDLNSDIVIRFSDPNFLKESNNWWISRRFHTVTLSFDHLTLNFAVGYSGSLRVS